MNSTETHEASMIIDSVNLVLLSFKRIYKR